jgi:hypothetical protein
MMVWLNEILRATRSALSCAMRTWLGKFALGVIVFATLATVAFLKYIPKPHMIDENRNKPILDELILDAFKCSEGTAQKIRLTVYYEDGTQQLYYPWGYAAPWKRVSPDTALGREMKFVCALQLTSESVDWSSTNETHRPRDQMHDPVGSCSVRRRRDLSEGTRSPAQWQRVALPGQ